MIGVFEVYLTVDRNVLSKGCLSVNCNRITNTFSNNEEALRNNVFRREKRHLTDAISGPMGRSIKATSFGRGFLLTIL